MEDLDDFFLMSEHGKDEDIDKRDNAVKEVLNLMGAHVSN